MRKSLCLCCLLFLFSGFEHSAEAQWKKVSSFLVPEGFQTYCFLTHLKSGLYAVQDSVLLRSIDDGENWQKLSVFPHMCELFSSEAWTIAANDSPLYVTAAYHEMTRLPVHGHFARSTDGGLSWRDTTTFAHIDYPPVTVLPNGRIIMAQSGYRNSIIHFSTNGGVSWDSTASAGLPVYAGVYNLISNASFLILSAYGEGESNQFLYRSTDYGESWTQLNTGLSVNVYYNVLLLGNSLFAIAYSNSWTSPVGITSTDEGLTWTVAPNPTCGSEVWTDGKSLFGHTDNVPVVVAGIGEPWRSWGDGLPMPLGWTPLQQLVFSDSHAFAMLLLPEPLRQEVWRRPLTELLSGVYSNNCLTNPTRYSLDQNYPNPFNPSTTIKFELPKASVVRLSVFDILGREVSILVNEKKDAGVHEVRFEAAGLASGVYFYRIQAGEFVQSKTFVLLR
jgi:hypothetical protein